jgi:hypothetical protein
MYVAGAAADVLRVTLLRVFVLAVGQWALNGRAASLLLQARLATSAPNSHQSASIGAQQ